MPAPARSSLSTADPGSPVSSVLLIDPDLALPCREDDPDLWFAESTADVERAKSLCGPCPIRTLCLDAARSRAEPWGVWGGEVFVGGVVVARKRGRGRPRRDAA